jgi:hypothetical protein
MCVCMDHTNIQFHVNTDWTVAEGCESTVPSLSEALGPLQLISLHHTQESELQPYSSEIGPLQYQKTVCSVILTHHTNGRLELNLDLGLWADERDGFPLWKPQEQRLQEHRTVHAGILNMMHIGSTYIIVTC